MRLTLKEFIQQVKEEHFTAPLKNHWEVWSKVGDGSITYEDFEQAMLMADVVRDPMEHDPELKKKYERFLEVEAARLNRKRS